MNIDVKIFKAYDIRGIYPTEIDEKSVEIIIRAIYTYFIQELKNEHLSVVLGRDMRVSSPSLFSAARKTLVASGATVIDVGLTPTPTFYYSVLKGEYDVGIIITASHNPKEYAGLKFVRREGNKILKIGKSTGMDKIVQISLAGQFAPFTNDGKVIEKKDALDDEIKGAIKLFDTSKFKTYKIVCDPANGMGSLYVKKLFEQIPGELIEMNFGLDGTFPAHQPDPLDFNNLKPLQERVKKERVDLGIASDGDGDRIFFVDENGEIIPATSITSLIVEEILKKNTDAKTIVDIRYTRNVSNVVDKFGAPKLHVSNVGHAFITEDVNKIQAAFAGESSGHFFFSETGGAESSVRVILYVLMAMSTTGKPISQILQELRSSYESGEFNFILPDGTDSKKLMEDISKEYAEGQISWQDGVAVDFPDWRFNIRSSNTEPLLRLNVESDNEEKTADKLKEVTDRILSAGAKPKESGH